MTLYTGVFPHRNPVTRAYPRRRPPEVVEAIGEAWAESMTMETALHRAASVIAQLPGWSDAERATLFRAKVTPIVRDYLEEVAETGASIPAPTEAALLATLSPKAHRVYTEAHGDITRFLTHLEATFGPFTADPCPTP